MTFSKWKSHCCVCKNMLMDTIQTRWIQPEPSHFPYGPLKYLPSSLLPSWFYMNLHKRRIKVIRTRRLWHELDVSLIIYYCLCLFSSHEMGLLACSNSELVYRTFEFFYTVGRIPSRRHRHIARSDKTQHKCSKITDIHSCIGWD
jgi:hypothetical protein